MENKHLTRIQSRFIPLENGCIEWSGTKKESGLGVTIIEGRMYYVHRILYEHRHGPLGRELNLTHLCKNPACVNIDHMEPVSARELALRGNGCFARCARATHCPRGHEYSGDNLYLRDGKYRGCNACKKIRAKASNERQRERKKACIPPRQPVEKTPKPSSNKKTGLPNTIDDLLSRCEIQDNGCWLWTGPLTHKGYGTAKVSGKSAPIHRHTYEHFVGPIPDGLVLDHLCRNKSCANPAHLEPVTNRENILRGEGLAAQQVKRTHCPYGHPYEGENLIVNKKGSRTCRECQRRRSREYMAKERTKQKPP